MRMPCLGAIASNREMKIHRLIVLRSRYGSNMAGVLVTVIPHAHVAILDGEVMVI